jgi:hypothetical protein
VRGKNVFFGLAMGMAAITRPEALGVFVALLAFGRRSWKNRSLALAAFLTLFLVNNAALSAGTGRFILIAWVREGKGLLIMDRVTGRTQVTEVPEKAMFTPAWSPDGRFIAAAAERCRAAHGSTSWMPEAGKPCFSPRRPQGAGCRRGARTADESSW